MSLCSVRPRPDPATFADPTSSTMIWLKRKSSTPGPPNSSGTAIASIPFSAAFANTERGTTPSCSHCSWCGTTSSARKRRTDSR